MKYNSIRSPWFWISILALIPLFLFILYPLVNVFISSLSGDDTSGWKELIQSPEYFLAIKNTLILAFIVTFICSLLGVPLAYVMARYRFPGKSLIAILPLITIVLPEVISAQTWLMLLGNRGVITLFLAGYGIRLPTFYGWFGLIISMSFMYYSYIYIGTIAAISKFDVQLEEAAQSLGTNPVYSRFKVMLPVIMPAILASSLLVFTMVIGNFAISMILSHGMPLLSVKTYQAALAEGSTNVTMQSTLASVSIFIVLSVLFVNRWIISRGNYEIVQGRHAPVISLRNLSGFFVAIGAGLIMIISLMPLVTVLIGAFTKSRGPVMYWGQWTFDNILRVFTTASGPLINSLIYASIATVLSVLFTAMVSYLIVKKPTIITKLLDYISAIPLALSGTVLGIGLITSFNGSWLPLVGTSTIIVVAYVIRRMPFGMRNSQSILHNIPNSLEEASISLGSAPVRTFFYVVLPVMLPAIISAAALTWTTTIAELSASILLYSGGRETLPIQVYRLIDSGLMSYASAYGLVLILIILLPILLVTKVMKIDIFAAK